MIKVSDRIIDLGPEGGDAGGHVVAEGTPEQVAANEQSYTGQYLRTVLGDGVPESGGHRKAGRKKKE